MKKYNFSFQIKVLALGMYLATTTDCLHTTCVCVCCLLKGICGRELELESIAGDGDGGDGGDGGGSAKAHHLLLLLVDATLKARNLIPTL